MQAKKNEVFNFLQNLSSLRSVTGRLKLSCQILVSRFSLIYLFKKQFFDLLPSVFVNSFKKEESKIRGKYLRLTTMIFIHFY